VDKPLPNLKLMKWFKLQPVKSFAYTDQPAYLKTYLPYLIFASKATKKFNQEYLEKCRLYDHHLCENNCMIGQLITDQDGEEHLVVDYEGHTIPKSTKSYRIGDYKSETAIHSFRNGDK
jgi:hypothetical protein